VNIIDNIRQEFGNYFFRKELKKVRNNRQIMNMNDAKTIGLVYDASDEVTYGIVSEFVRFFQESQKTVKAFGYVNYNRLPHYCFPKLSYDYITKRDLNWYMKPKNTKATDFINEEFDILIDLCIHDCFPIKYVSCASKAKFKVGKYGEKHSAIYDFMLNVDKTISLEEYIKEITHYLNLINKNQNS
jgi:hypothetical protein